MWTFVFLTAAAYSRRGKECRFRLRRRKTFLTYRRRPPEFGGTGKDPVFEMDTDELPEELEYLPDPNKPATHGFIRPAYTMSFEHYQRALHATRELWQPV